jgi:hypothetical protein
VYGIALRIGDPSPESRPLTYCLIQASIIQLFQARVGRRCGHSRDRAFVVPASHETYQIRAAHHFALLCEWDLGTSPSVCTLFGTQDNKLRQLFALGQSDGPAACRNLVCRQGASCLSCAFDRARSLFKVKNLRDFGTKSLLHVNDT